MLIGPDGLILCYAHAFCMLQPLIMLTQKFGFNMKNATLDDGCFS